MSLTRYLPTPSDRMGILWNLLSVQESIVLEYGPAGTTHFSMSLYGKLGLEYENRLFTTHMNEDDVVMGDVSRLEAALLELDKAYHPKVIFVVASSIAAVIGTDIQGVCNYMSDRVEARLISFDQGGFRGDYSVGCQSVWKLLAEKFPKREIEKRKNTYNLLGVSAGAYRIRSDVWELENLMEEAFHMQLGTCFCLNTSVSELETAGGAAINLVLRDEALSCAKVLEERFGTPSYLGAPYGYQATLEWLQGIGNIIGKQPEDKIVRRLREKAGKAALYRMSGIMLKRDRPKATFVGEYYTVTGLAKFLKQMGIEANYEVCLHSLKTIKRPAETVHYLETEGERINMLREVHHQIVFGDDISIGMCPTDNVFVRIGMPMIRGVQVANHLPIVGEKGADTILERVEEYFQLMQ